MSTITSPIILDETGKAIVEAIKALKTSTGNICYGMHIDGKFQVNGNSYFNARQVILKSARWGEGHPAMIMDHELTFQWYNNNIYVYVDNTQIGYLNITRT